MILMRRSQMTLRIISSLLKKPSSVFSTLGFSNMAFQQAVCIALAASYSASSFADEPLSDVRVRFVQDSNTDRRPAQTAFPKYPSIARRDRIEGEATVCFVIDDRGKISRISVKDYSNRIFRRPALRAIRNSSFEPLEPGNFLPRAKTCRTYRFRLEPIVAEEDASDSP